MIKTKLQNELDNQEITHSTLSNMSGISRVQITRYANGQTPSPRNAVRIASALNRQLHELFVEYSSNYHQESHQKRRTDNPALLPQNDDNLHIKYNQEVNQ